VCANSGAACNIRSQRDDELNPRQPSAAISTPVTSDIIIIIGGGEMDASVLCKCGGGGWLAF